MKVFTKAFVNLIKNNIRLAPEPDGYCVMQSKYLPPAALESKLDMLKDFAEKVNGELAVTKKAYIRGDRRYVQFTLTGDVVDMKVLDTLVINAAKAQQKSTPEPER